MFHFFKNCYNYFYFLLKRLETLVFQKVHAVCVLSVYIGVKIVTKKIKKNETKFVTFAYNPQ
jgi:hypothetical protein